MNRVLILSLSSDSKENYEKLRDIWSKLSLKPGSFSPCCDLKVINIVLGLMTHSAKHPCPWCHWVKGDRDGDCVLELRTFEGIRAWHEKSVAETNRDSPSCKLYFNCQDVPLSMFPEEGLVLDFVPLPELHLLLGIVNKLTDELLKVLINF